MCNASWVSHEKAEKTGRGFYASWTKVAGNCMKWIDPVKNFFPVWPLWGEGGFSAMSLMRCSMMHEIYCGKVMSCDMTRAEYLTKRQKRRGGGGGGVRPIWTNLRFRRLINIGISINERPITPPLIQIYICVLL